MMRLSQFRKIACLVAHVRAQFLRYAGCFDKPT